MTGGSKLSFRSAAAAPDNTAEHFFQHSQGKRVDTDTVITEALRRQYPELKLTVIPIESCNLLEYAATGHAEATPLEEAGTDPAFAALKWRYYFPPGRRLDGGKGILADEPKFAKFQYRWKDHDFILYVAEGRIGHSYIVEVYNSYLLSTDETISDQLLLEAGHWLSVLHNQVWVFDGGFWEKSWELWQSVQNASWDNVILDPDMKKAIIGDVNNFFNSRDTYEKLKVPWKRGIIYHGPPGNGKTISIKAMMHDLYKRDEAIPTLYVRSLSSWGGPEYSLNSIFTKARQTAPCYLVFEDLDSIVSDDVRSYFLNEVDGLKGNDGILMVGSTNHLDRLDPGISKRPSRFDRKYYFPEPNYDERVAYCEFWRGKLADNEDIKFPEKLSSAVAGITDGFSFAYMQEAFVASLLAIAARSDDDDAVYDNSWRQPGANKTVSTEMVVKDEDPDLKDLVLWKEMKKQVKILREEMDSES